MKIKASTSEVELLKLCDSDLKPSEKSLVNLAESDWSNENKPKNYWKGIINQSKPLESSSTFFDIRGQNAINNQILDLPLDVAIFPQSPLLLKPSFLNNSLRRPILYVHKGLQSHHIGEALKHLRNGNSQRLGCNSFTPVISSHGISDIRLAPVVTRPRVNRDESDGSVVDADRAAPRMGNTNISNESQGLFLGSESVPSNELHDSIVSSPQHEIIDIGELKWAESELTEFHIWTEGAWRNAEEKSNGFEGVELGRGCALTQAPTTTNYDVGAAARADLRRAPFPSAMEVTSLGHGSSWSAIDPVQVCTFPPSTSLPFYTALSPSRFRDFPMWDLNNLPNQPSPGPIPFSNYIGDFFLDKYSFQWTVFLFFFLKNSVLISKSLLIFHLILCLQLSIWSLSI